MQTFGLIVAVLLFILGLVIVRWAVFDGSYTALFGVQTQLEDRARIWVTVLGVALWLPLLISAIAARAINKLPRDRNEIDVDPKQETVTLTPWEQELIDKARQKRGE